MLTGKERGRLVAIKRVLPSKKITKRAVDALRCPPDRDRVFLWDEELTGFGVTAFAGGKKTYFIQYRLHGRTHRFAIGAHGTLTPDEARGKARRDLAAVERGQDPIDERRREREVPTFQKASDDFMAAFKRQIGAGEKKLATYKAYRITLDQHILPELGSRRIADLTDADVKKLHRHLAEKKYTANKALALISSIWNWAAGEKLGVIKQNNPATSVKPYKTEGRERYLTSDELSRLGDVLRQAETVGLPWAIDETNPKSKHAPKIENRRQKIDEYAVAAIRLLILTGARLREILHAKWEYVDFERHMIRLPASKTGKKTIYLSAAAEAVLSSVNRIDNHPFVFPGEKDGKPRADINKPWRAIIRAARLDRVRAHDLRHSFASFGAGKSLGLPIIGKLLGHTQVATTARYAHLDADPMRRAVDTIGATIAAAMDGRGSNVVELPKPARRP
jgi:integrase